MKKKAKVEIPNRDKGSYRHMLDLVSANNFCEIMNELLKGTDSCLANPDCRHPCGRSKKRDWTEVELEDYLKRHPVKNYSGLNRRWWIAFKGSRPTWDLICHIDVEGVPGLLIIEAKAHLGEMSEKNCKSEVDRKNPRSIANDLSIRLRLAEASLGLNEFGSGAFCLSADHDYQLSNRLAYLYKLACDGVPTVLMYLGWIGSPDWTNDPFTTANAWQQAVKGHFERIGNWDVVERKHKLQSGTSFQMITRSLRPKILATS